MSKSGYPYQDIKILCVFTSDHQHVYDTEQWIHNVLEGKGLSHEGSDWSTETFQLGVEDLAKGIAVEKGLKVFDMSKILL